MMDPLRPHGGSGALRHTPCSCMVADWGTGSGVPLPVGEAVCEPVRGPGPNPNQTNRRE